jgi:hypothetical protein
MIRKLDGINIPELLKELKELILNKMGFDLNFTQKEMDQGYTIEQII